MAELEGICTALRIDHTSPVVVATCEKSQFNNAAFARIPTCMEQHGPATDPEFNKQHAPTFQCTC